jgi:hypothetical protein
MTTLRLLSLAYINIYGIADKPVNRIQVKLASHRPHQQCKTPNHTKMTVTNAFQELTSTNLEWYRLIALSKGDAKAFADAFTRSGTGVLVVKKRARFSRLCRYGILV